MVLKLLNKLSETQFSPKSQKKRICLQSFSHGCRLTRGVGPERSLNPLFLSTPGSSFNFRYITLLWVWQRVCIKKWRSNFREKTLARVILQTLPSVGFLETHLPPFMELKRWEKSLAWRNTHLTCWNLFSSFQFWWFSFCFRKQQKSNILGWEVATWYSFPEPDFSITSNFGQNYHQRCFFILGNIFIFIWPSILLHYVSLAV